MTKLLLILLFVTTASTSARADGYVIVGNAKATVPQIAKSELKALYTGKAKLFADRVAIVVIRADDDPVFEAFASGVLGVSAKTLLSKIKQEVFKGDMNKPFKAASDDDVIQHVASNPGSVGVIAAGAAKTLPRTVAVIAVGG